MEDFDGFPNFKGFHAPETTQVPDVLIDKIMVHLGEGELKTLLYIVRRTYGFGKQEDYISLSQMLNGIVSREGEQLDYGTGLSKKSLLKALASLKEKNLILAKRRSSPEKGNEPTLYQLRMRGQISSTPPLGEQGIQGDGELPPPRARGSKSPTQYPVIQSSSTKKAVSKKKAGNGVNTLDDVDKYFRGPHGHLVQR